MKIKIDASQAPKSIKRLEVVADPKVVSRNKIITPSSTNQTKPNSLKNK